MDALIIKKPWIDYILSGKKTWEIRGCATTKRGKIELIQSGSGLVVGCCNLTDCFKVSKQELANATSKHLIEDAQNITYKNIYAWVLNDVQKYKTPKKYKHPKGAIIWVKIKNGLDF